MLFVYFYLGLWSVANELEDPFRNVPNDIPLNNFQAQFNEALVCMFAGYHPEAWWDIDEREQSIPEDAISHIMDSSLEMEPRSSVTGIDDES